MPNTTTGGNAALHAARAAGNDEFYTQYEDIEKEIQCYLEYDENVFRDKVILLPCDDPEWSNFTKYFALNFEEFGLKQLVSTCYNEGGQGRIAVINSQKEANNITWTSLQGDGDFSSKEVTNWRDKADIIITNPPFSVFREFIAWLIDSGKKFLSIGNMNAITYKEVFPLIRNNVIWLGKGFAAGNAYFRIPDSARSNYADGVFDHETHLVKFRNCCWFTNLDYGNRHEPLPLMSMADNLKYSKHKELKGKREYEHYDNYDAIEVPYTDSIPNDYEGNMGVPISFLDKYCPEQFEILDARDFTNIKRLKHKSTYLIKDADGSIKGQAVYARILIRKRK